MRSLRPSSGRDIQTTARRRAPDQQRGLAGLDISVYASTSQQPICDASYEVPGNQPVAGACPSVKHGAHVDTLADGALPSPARLDATSCANLPTPKNLARKNKPPTRVLGDEEQDIRSDCIGPRLGLFPTVLWRAGELLHLPSEADPGIGRLIHNPSSIVNPSPRDHPQFLASRSLAATSGS
ncbi:hypothetical protein JHW43_001570 [Diplocarpon mali]|nr:hypothetical protein JHW43_001570 [Diplocarpon mali]